MTVSVSPTNHDDVISAAKFVRNADRDTLWLIVAGETLADALVVELARAEWRYRHEVK